MAAVLRLDALQQRVAPGALSCVLSQFWHGRAQPQFLDKFHQLRVNALQFSGRGYKAVTSSGLVAAASPRQGLVGPCRVPPWWQAQPSRRSCQYRNRQRLGALTSLNEVIIFHRGSLVSRRQLFAACSNRWAALSSLSRGRCYPRGLPFVLVL